jgi:class 3 adenylate cyclase/tetratricopeptide (TPR) repeat protein
MAAGVAAKSVPSSSPLLDSCAARSYLGLDIPAVSVDPVEALVKCSRCQVDNRDGVKFCENCGAHLDLVCPRCGSVVLEDRRFCGACGGSLTRSPRERFSSPHDYTPQYLAEKILGARETLEGERKQVTVLLADVRGSLELLADRDPEDARRVLDPVLTEMMEAVHRYEGTVNQVMGDGIMALFGAPLAHEDHAVRACYAALRMQESIAALAEELRQSQGLSVQVRIGLNSGEVVVRSIGSDLRMDYTAVGQATHLAGRMEQLAHPSQIFLTEQTLRLAEGFITVKPLGLVPIKGLSAPVPVFELTGPGPIHTRLQLAAARGLTRFVGREAELAELQEAMEEASRGHGQIVALVGEPGVGKSRLVYEFTRGRLRPEWRVHAAFATSFDTRAAYLPTTSLLRGYFDIEYGDDIRRIREKVTAALLDLDASLVALLPALLSVLNVTVEDPAWVELDARQRRSRTLEAVRRLLFRESQRHALCLIIEDLHWIDPEAQTVFDSLVEGLPTARILLLVTYRPEYEHGWSRKSYYAQLAIRPLPLGMADELLRDLLGEAADVKTLKRQLIERTEGNPLFLEESVRHLVETGLLAGQRGAYRLTRRDATSEVPATIQALLGARIDRLAETDKGVLQCASVIGKDIPATLLEAIVGATQDELRRCLAHLQAAEFLYEASLFPVHEYTFKHALTLDVAYGTLLQERRRTLHAQIVGAIETLFADRLIEYLDRLAHHSFRGEAWPKAVTYLRQAGTRAAARSLNREAIARFQEALVALGHLPESRDVVEQVIDIRVEIRHCLLLLGDHGQIFEHLRQAAALAAQLGDQRRLGWVSSYMTHHWWYTGDPELAIDSGRQALAIADAADDPVLRVLTNFHLGQAYHALGEYRRAIEFFAETVTSPQRDILDERFGILYSVRSRSWLAWCFAELGDFDEGLAYGEDGVRIAEVVDQPFSLITACVGVGVLYLRKGELLKAIMLLERGLALCHARDLPVLFPTIASRLGAAYVLLGRLQEALPLLERAADEAASMNRLSGHSLRLTHLGEAYLAVGRTEDALVAATRAVDLSRKHKEGGSQAWALRLLGEIKAREDTRDLKEADAAFTQSLTLATALGMRPLVAHCHSGLARVQQQIGGQGKAEEHHRIATQMFEQMGMVFWQEQVETGWRRLLNR